MFFFKIDTKTKRLTVEQHVKYRCSKREDIVTGSDFDSAVDSVTGIDNITAAWLFTSIDDRIVIGKHHLAALDDDISRANVTMHKADTMELR